jgi:hypothetical protein
MFRVTEYKNAEICGLCSTPWRYTFEVWLENMKGLDRLEDLDVDKRIILEWMLKTWGGQRVWAGFIWPRIGATLMNLRMP